MQATQTNLSKVPAVTLLFWILKIAATTLGETGGDAVTMSLGLGYLVGSWIFVALFAVMVLAQLSARAFHPWRVSSVALLGNDRGDHDAISRYTASAVLLAFMVACLLIFRQKPASASAT